MTQARGCLVALLLYLMCLPAYALKTLDPVHSAQLSRLYTISNELLPRQHEILRNLQSQQRLADNPDYVFMSPMHEPPRLTTSDPATNDFEDTVVPMSRMEFRARVNKMLNSGRLDYDTASQYLNGVEKFSEQYRQQLSRSIAQTHQIIRSLTAEMNDLRRGLARTQDTPLSGGGQVRMSNLEQGTNRYGLDYNDAMHETEATPQGCSDRCLRDEKCKSFSWVRAGVQGDSPRCWLKYAVPSPSQNSCCVSGKKIFE